MNATASEEQSVNLSGHRVGGRAGESRVVGRVLWSAQVHEAVFRAFTLPLPNPPVENSQSSRTYLTPIHPTFQTAVGFFFWRVTLKRFKERFRSPSLDTDDHSTGQKLLDWLRLDPPHNRVPLPSDEGRWMPYSDATVWSLVPF